MQVLTLVDVLHIQRFVFSTNRLRDVVAGSEFVAAATSAETLLAVAGESAPDVIYSAGGNALIRFPSLDKARLWAAAYSRHLLEKYPGLQVAVEHEELDLADAPVASLLRLGERLARAKLSVSPDGTLHGLSVTAECVETRAPATYRFSGDGEESALATGPARRRAWHASSGRSRWTPLLASRPTGVTGKRYAFPLDLDKLGRTFGEDSLMAVVHVDANRVGRRIRNALLQWDEEGLSLADALPRLAVLSTTLSTAMNAVMQGVVDRVCAAVVRAPDGTPRLQSGRLDSHFDLFLDDEAIYLPIRPVVLGGDDLTFVCDGRIALDLASHALQLIEDAVQDDMLTACAGVAIVKSHAPFARAYDLAQELVRGAKDKFEGKVSAIDWHVGIETTLEGIGRLRHRVYRAEMLNLTLRPYRLHADRAASYRWMDEQVLGGGSATAGLLGSQWQRSRNKLKALRDVVRGGPTAVRASLDAWQVTAILPPLPGGLEASNGFLGGSGTPLLDVLELLDIHLPLSDAPSGERPAVGEGGDHAA